MAANTWAVGVGVMPATNVAMVPFLVVLVYQSTIFCFSETASQPVTKSVTRRQRQAREYACKHVTIDFGFTSDLLRSWLEIF